MWIGRQVHVHCFLIGSLNFLLLQLLHFNFEYTRSVTSDIAGEAQAIAKLCYRYADVLCLVCIS